MTFLLVRMHWSLKISFMNKEVDTAMEIRETLMSQSQGCCLVTRIFGTKNDYSSSLRQPWKCGEKCLKRQHDLNGVHVWGRHLKRRKLTSSFIFSHTLLRRLECSRFQIDPGTTFVKRKLRKLCSKSSLAMLQVYHDLLYFFLCVFPKRDRDR